MLPMGTANVLACEFRLPWKVGAVAELIAAGNTRSHATGTANGRRFVLFVGAGLDGRMVERVEQVRDGTLGKLKWIAPVLSVARQLPRHELDIELEDGTTRTGLSEVIVTRVRNYGGVFHLPRGIDAASDRLHVLCFRQRSRLAWLRAAAAAAFLSGLRAPTHCELLTTRALRIRAADPTPYQLDGDFAGATPIDIRLEAEPTRLVVPPL
jgi:diacylglycerol kinase family enzyme